MIQINDIHDPQGKRITSTVGVRRADVVRCPNSQWDVFYFDGDKQVVCPSRKELPEFLPFETALLIGKQWVRDEPGVDNSWPAAALARPWEVKNL